MKLFHLYRIDKNAGLNYDEALAFVVRAETGKAARALAASACGAEGKATWTDSKKSRCRVLEPGKTADIVVRDFING